MKKKAPKKEPFETKPDKETKADVFKENQFKKKKK